MRISKTTEAYILCTLAVMVYPFVRLFYIIKEQSLKKKYTESEDTE